MKMKNKKNEEYKECEDERMKVMISKPRTMAFHALQILPHLAYSVHSVHGRYPHHIALHSILRFERTFHRPI